MGIQQYIDNLDRHHRNSIAREQTYRRDLQTLVSELLPGVLVINEPADKRELSGCVWKASCSIIAI